MKIIDLIPYLTGFLSLCIIVGGILAVKQGYSKSAAEIQARVISALKDEVETLRSKIEDCEKEQCRLRQVIETIQSALKQRGIHITIDGDMVTIDEIHTDTRKTTVRKSTPRPAKKEES